MAALAEVEGRTRIEGVAASIHECYMDDHGNKVAEDAVFKTPCVAIIFDEGPRYREVQSKSGSKQPRMMLHRDRGSGLAETWAACSDLILGDALGLTLRPRFKLDVNDNPLDMPTNKIYRRGTRPTNKIGYRTR